MFEHVGEARLAEYFGRLRAPASARRAACSTTASAGRPGQRARLPARSFINRYVFPDGELHEVGRVVSLVQHAGFEVRHVETLREHYALTLRHWVANLEANWDAAVEEVGEARARVWRLYMAGLGRQLRGRAHARSTRCWRSRQRRRPLGHAPAPRVRVARERRCAPCRCQASWRAIVPVS